MSTRYFYEEFKGREDLLEAVYADVLATALRTAIEALRAEGTATERLHAAILAYVQHVTEEPGRVRLLHSDSRRMPSLAPIRHRFMGQVWSEVGAVWADLNGTDVPDPPVLSPGRAFALAGATTEVLTHWFSTPEPRPEPARLAELMARTLAPAVLGSGRRA